MSETPKDWNEYKLQDLIVSHNSGVYKKKELYGDGVNIVGVSNLYDSLFIDGQQYRSVPLTDAEIEKHTLNENDLLYGESSLVRSGIARTVCVTKDGEGTAFAWHTRRLKINQEKAFSPYLVNALAESSMRLKIEAVATQTALTGMTTKDLFSVDISLPPLPEQQKIASILTSVDDVIEKTQSQINKLQDLKKATMNELLTKGIGHTEFKDSPVGRIPKGWRVQNVGMFTEEHKQGYYTKEKYRDSGKYLIRITDLHNPDIEYINMPKLPLTNKDFIAYKVEKGDFLFARSGAIGRYGIVTESVDAVFASYLIRFRFSNEMSTRFIGYVYESDLCQKQLSYITQGSSNININAENIKSLLMPVPPTDEQKEIASKLDSIDNFIKNTIRKLEHVKSLKKALMQDLLTGKVRVPLS